MRKKCALSADCARLLVWIQFLLPTQMPVALGGCTVASALDRIQHAAFVFVLLGGVMSALVVCQTAQQLVGDAYGLSS